MLRHTQLRSLHCILNVQAIPAQVDHLSFALIEKHLPFLRLSHQVTLQSSPILCIVYFAEDFSVVCKL